MKSGIGASVSWCQGWLESRRGSFLSIARFRAKIKHLFQIRPFSAAEDAAVRQGDVVVLRHDDVVQQLHADGAQGVLGLLGGDVYKRQILRRPSPEQASQRPPRVLKLKRPGP